MNYEKKMIDIVKVHGVNIDTTTILRISNGGQLFMRKSGRKWRLLDAIVKTEKDNEETLRFYMVEVGNDGNDTARMELFKWEDLREELKIAIRTWIDRHQ